MRILWDRDEALILLDSLLAVLDGKISRKEAVASISIELRERAKRLNVAIDDIFRNTNGIGLQMRVMEYILTDGQQGLKKQPLPKLYQEVVDLYRKDRRTYDKLLKEAKAMSVAKSVQEQFLTWLSAEVSPAQLSELYISCTDIESFCIQREILECKLFETTDLSTIDGVIKALESNRDFRYIYRHNLPKMISAMRFYYRFIKEHPNLNITANIQSETNARLLKQCESSAIEPTGMVLAEKSAESIPYQVQDYVVDFTSAEDLTYTTPLSFSYFDDEEDDIENWSQLYVKIFSYLIDDYPDVLKTLINKSLSGQGDSDFADKRNSSFLIAPKKVADNFYLETRLNPTNIVTVIRQALDICNVDYENVEIHYRKKEVPVQQIGLATESEISSPSPATDRIRFNRIQFINWMKESGYTSATIFGYLSAVSKCAKAAQEYGVATEDLLLISDVDELMQIRMDFLKLPALSALNTQQQNRLHVALDKLIEFRTGTQNLKPDPTIKAPQSKPDEESANSVEILSSKTQAYYAIILKKYFSEDGYQPERSIFHGRFRRNYAVEYGYEPNESDERIDEILSQVGTQRDGRIFPLQNANQRGLIYDIVADVLSAFEDGASAVYLEAVYAKYQQQLAEQLHVYHANALAPLLLTCANGRFVQKFSYFTVKGKSADSAGDILRIMKEFHQPQSYDAIHEKAWYIPFERMKTLLAVDKSIVNVATGTYFYAPNLPLSADELKQLIAVINIELDYRSHITDVEMMDLIQAKCPSIAINTEEYTTYGLRNCLGYILREHFSFKGPIISAIGSEVSMSDVYGEFARTHETLQVEDLSSLSADMNVVIYWDSVLVEMVRISESELVRRDLIPFDVNAVDTILDELCPGNYIPLKDITLFLYFPNIGYPWNSYVLESYLFRCSRKFRLFHATFAKSGVYGAMVRTDSAITDYRTLLVDALSQSNALSSTKAALQFIVDSGFQQRRRYEGIEQLVQEAKLLKEKTENQEK